MFDIPAGFQLTDDLDVALDPNEYQDRALPMPVPAGNYGARIKQAGLKTEYENPDKVVLVKDENGTPKYPVIVISELELALPAEFDGRKVFPMGFGQEFGTKPFERPLFPGSSERVPANNIADMVRAHDTNLSFRGTDAGMQLLQRLINDGAIFYVQLDWIAEDRKWVVEQIKLIDAALENGEITEDTARQKRREVRFKLGRQEGMSKFVGEDGQLNPVWVGPSGEEIEARAFIRQFISVADLGRYKLGPKAVRARRATSRVN